MDKAEKYLEEDKEHDEVTIIYGDNQNEYIFKPNVVTLMTGFATQENKLTNDNCDLSTETHMKEINNLREQIEELNKVLHKDVLTLLGRVHTLADEKLVLKELLDLQYNGCHSSKIADRDRRTEIALK